MSRRVVVLLAAVLLVQTFELCAPLLLHHERAPHCSCPIKGPCCEKEVCPMDAARRAKDQVSLRSCGGAADGDPIALSFLRSPAVLPPPMNESNLAASNREFVQLDADAHAGAIRIIEQPPRSASS
jgi:hypothetical protein